MASIRFPADLRPPDREGYSDNYEVIQSEFVPEIGASRRRNRFTTAPREFSVEWIFTQREFAIFDEWHETAICGGEREFDIQLLDDAYALVWYTVTAPEPFRYEIVEPEGVYQFRVTWKLRAKSPSFGTIRPSGTDELGGSCIAGVFNASGKLKVYAPFFGTCEPSVSATLRTLLSPLSGVSEVGMYQLPILRYSGVTLAERESDSAIRETDLALNREID